MNVTLNWTPGAGATSQDVQYKLSTSPSWSTHSIVGGAVTTATISGLSDNLIYDFRVVTNCPGGTSAGSFSVQQINIICPTVSTTLTDTTVSYAFTSPGGSSITGYVVDLLDASGTTVVQTQSKSTTSPVTGTFSGLTAATSYKVRVTVQADTFSKQCPATDVTTSATPVCNAPTGVTATLDEPIT